MCHGFTEIHCVSGNTCPVHVRTGDVVQIFRMLDIPVGRTPFEVSHDDADFSTTFGTPIDIVPNLFVVSSAVDLGDVLKLSVNLRQTTVFGVQMGTL